MAIGGASDSGATWTHRLQQGVAAAGAIKTGTDIGRAIWGAAPYVARVAGMVL